MKRFPITGKGVFKDRTEGVVYAMLDGTNLIQLENKPEDLAMLAWSQANRDQHLIFLEKNFHNAIFWNTEQVDKKFDDLPQDVKDILIQRQRELLNLA